MSKAVPTAAGVSAAGDPLAVGLPVTAGALALAPDVGVASAAVRVAAAGVDVATTGVQAPRASWGSLIAAGQDAIRTSPHLVYLPGLTIALALMSFTFLGDGLRDALDPKLKGKQ